MNLQQWYQGADFFDFNKHKIFYRVEGHGRPLVFIHGFPTASYDWYKIWPALTQHFTCISLDMLGFGYSDKPKQTYCILEQADILCALLKHLSVDGCHILSHDYGDTVAQELLARHNQAQLDFTILSLHLLNGGLFPETHRPVLTQKLMLSPIGWLLVHLLRRSSLAKNLKKIFSPDTPPSEQEINDFWALIRHNQGHLVMHKLIRYMQQRATHRARWVGALQSANIPIRLTVGMLDPVSGAHMLENYRQHMKHCDVIELADIGHYPQIEASERVLSSVMTFLQQIQAGKTASN